MKHKHNSMHYVRIQVNQLLLKTMISDSWWQVQKSKHKRWSFSNIRRTQLKLTEAIEYFQGGRQYELSRGTFKYWCSFWSIFQSKKPLSATEFLLRYWNMCRYKLACVDKLCCRSGLCSRVFLTSDKLTPLRSYSGGSVIVSKQV